MTMQDQKVEIDYGNGNYGKLLGQTITDIVIDEEGYAYGYWGTKLVATFSLKSGTWFVM